MQRKMYTGTYPATTACAVRMLAKMGYNETALPDDRKLKRRITADSWFASRKTVKACDDGLCQRNLYVHLAFLSNKKGFFRLSKDLLNISYVLSGKSCEKYFEKLKSAYPKHFEYFTKGIPKSTL